MKVLIATFTFPPAKNGVSMASATMARGFLDRGWSVDISTAPCEPARETNDWDGARIHEFKITGDGSPKRPFRGDVESYRNFLRQGDWDVIVFHAHFWNILVAVSALKEIPARKILVSHGYAVLLWTKTGRFPWGLGAWGWSLLRALHMAFWMKRLDRAVFLSEQSDFRSFFDHWIACRSGYTGRRVIANGVDPTETGSDPGSFRQQHGIKDGQFMFLCVGYYSPGKDQGFAARAFRQAQLENAVLVFIGNEFNNHARRFMEDDEAIAEGERSGRILWLEKLDRETTLNAFATCDCVVLSSDNEAQPIVLIEAMRESKPWIAREAGCISEMPGGICVQSESEMTEWMRRVADDPQLGKKLGGSGREAVMNTYNLDTYQQTYADLAEEVCGVPTDC